MPSAFSALRVVHLLAMSVWMGAGLLAPRDVADSVVRDPTGLGPLLGRLRRTGRLMNASASLTLLSGLGLVALGRGLATPPRIFWGLALTLLAIAVGRWVIRPAVVGMVHASVADRGVDPAALAALARRFALGVHGETALRLLALVTMVR